MGELALFTARRFQRHRHRLQLVVSNGIVIGIVPSGGTVHTARLKELGHT
jgi:hypothetical protein